MQDFALNRVRPLFATLARRLRAAAVRRQPAHHRRHARSRQAPAVPHLARGGDRRRQQGDAGDARPATCAPAAINRIARTNAALGGNLAELLDTPIRPASGTTVYLRDIGTIENGTDIVTAYAHVNGKRTVYIPVTKRADASTLAVINAREGRDPRFQEGGAGRRRCSPGVRPVAAMSRNSIRGLVTEGLLGAVLTGLMVLLFLRDWRSALIVVAEYSVRAARRRRPALG